MALQNDNKVQNHYSKEVFNCHYLPDTISKLRLKLGEHFEVNGFDIIVTQKYSIQKANGEKRKVGIYRIAKEYKQVIKGLLYV